MDDGPVILDMDNMPDWMLGGTIAVWVFGFMLVVVAPWQVLGKMGQHRFLRTLGALLLFLMGTQRVLEYWWFGWALGYDAVISDWWARFGLGTRSLEPNTLQWILFGLNFVNAVMVGYRGDRHDEEQEQEKAKMETMLRAAETILAATAESETEVRGARTVVPHGGTGIRMDEMDEHTSASPPVLPPDEPSNEAKNE